MSDATLARVEHGKYVGVRGEPRRDGVCLLRKRSVLISVYFIESCDSLRPESRGHPYAMCSVGSMMKDARTKGSFFPARPLSRTPSRAPERGKEQKERRTSPPGPGAQSTLARERGRSSCGKASCHLPGQLDTAIKPQADMLSGGY